MPSYHVHSVQLCIGSTPAELGPPACCQSSCPLASPLPHSLSSFHALLLHLTIHGSRPLWETWLCYFFPFSFLFFVLYCPSHNHYRVAVCVVGQRQQWVCFSLLRGSSLSVLRIQQLPCKIHNILPWKLNETGSISPLGMIWMRCNVAVVTVS